MRPAIAALEEAVQLLAHLGRVAPVVGRAGVVLVLGADEGAVLDPGHVGGVGEGEVGVRPLRVGELLEGAGVDQGLGEGVVLLGGAVAPVDRVGLGQRRDLADPGEQFGVGGQARGPWSGRSFASLYFFGLRPTKLTSASVLRIFKVAVACLPLGYIDRASEGLGRFDLLIGGAIDGLDLCRNRLFEVCLDRCLGLGAVEHRFAAAGSGDRQRQRAVSQRLRAPAPGYSSPERSNSAERGFSDFASGRRPPGSALPRSASIRDSTSQCASSSTRVRSPPGRQRRRRARSPSPPAPAPAAGAGSPRRAALPGVTGRRRGRRRGRRSGPPPGSGGSAMVEASGIAIATIAASATTRARSAPARRSGSAALRGCGRAARVTRAAASRSTPTGSTGICQTQSKAAAKQKATQPATRRRAAAPAVAAAQRQRAPPPTRTSRGRPSSRSQADDPELAEGLHVERVGVVDDARRCRRRGPTRTRRSRSRCRSAARLLSSQRRAPELVAAVAGELFEPRRCRCRALPARLNSSQALERLPGAPSAIAAITDEDDATPSGDQRLLPLEPRPAPAHAATSAIEIAAWSRRRRRRRRSSRPASRRPGAGRRRWRGRGWSASRWAAAAIRIAAADAGDQQRQQLRQPVAR